MKIVEREMNLMLADYNERREVIEEMMVDYSAFK